MKRVLRRLCAMVLAVLAMTLVTLAPVRALAEESPDEVAQAVIGDDYPYKNYGMEGYDPWNFVYRNCTSFVAWRLNSANGVEFNNWYGGVRWGAASNWGNAARSLGIAVDNNPAIGSVAWNSSGHVAWVADVGNGTVTIEEYNWDGDGRYHTRDMPVTHYSGFIHIKDGGDTTPPTISNARIGELGEDGFTVLADVTDNVGLSDVRVAVWTESGGQDDTKWYTMVAASGTSSYSVRIPFSDHNNERGNYIAHVYAYDLAGNEKLVGVVQAIDSTPPTISNVQVTNLMSYGYTVSCTVTDNTGVLRVQFPTWTTANGQDDLASEWWTNPKVTGTKDGTKYTFNVKTSDHNSEPGPYATHIYAYDSVGNVQKYEVPFVDLSIYMNDTEPPVIQSATVVEQSDKCIVVDVVVTDNVEVTQVSTKSYDIYGDRRVINMFGGVKGVEQISDTKWRVTLDLDVNPGSMPNIMGADTHRVYFYACDASGNRTPSNESATHHIDFDLQMSKHVQLEVGQSIATTEVFGANRIQYYNPLNWNDGILDITNTTITALEEGECWLYYSNYQTSEIMSAYVVVGTPTVDIAGATVSSIADQTYTGKAIKPSLTVKYGSTTLVSGTDYTASYSSNTNAGTATVTLTGKGSYTGTKKVTFTIKPTAISKATASAIPDQTYTGKTLTPKPTLTFGGATLKESTDYTLAYKNNTNEGTATVTVTGRGNFTGTTSLTFKIVKATTPEVTWKRLAGAGRYDTMSAIVRQGWSGVTGGTVVVATGAGFKDALAAAGLAGLDGAPVVLTDGSSLSPQAAARLSALAPSMIYVAGGPAAVSSNVLSQIRAEVGVSPIRVMGQTSSGTSAALARQGAGRWSGGTAIIATNKTFKDALSAAPVAYAKHWPILLADNGASLSSDVLSALQECGVTQVYIVGGEAAVTPRVASQLTSAGIAVRGRLAGRTAVATSRAIADFALGSGLGARGMAFATSQNFPDALAGAALCGKNGSVLLLADDKAQANIAFAREHVAEIGTGYVFGGTYAFSDGLLASLPTQ